MSLAEPEAFKGRCTLPSLVSHSLPKAEEFQTEEKVPLSETVTGPSLETKDLVSIQIQTRINSLFIQGLEGHSSQSTSFWEEAPEAAQGQKAWMVTHFHKG